MADLPAALGRGAVPNGVRPVLNVLSAQEVRERDERMSDAAAKLAQKEPALSGLIGYVRAKLDAAKTAKDASGAEDMLLESLRRRRGEYDESKKAKLQAQGEPLLFVPLTETKCNAAEAWMSDVLAPHGDKIWSLVPTPLPELSPDAVEQINRRLMMELEEDQQMLQQAIPQEAIQRRKDMLLDSAKEEAYTEAKKRANAMEKLIEDQLAQSDWAKTFKDFLSCLVTFGTGILKGPVVRSRPDLSWEGGEPVARQVTTPQAENVSPLDFFPSPDASEVSDGYMIERMKLTRAQLWRVKDLDSYQTKQIEELLNSQSPATQHTVDDEERRQLEGKDLRAITEDRSFEVYEFWGPVPGYHLLDWGVKGVERDLDYEFQVMWSGAHVIKVMANPDPLDRRPYHKATFKRTVGSFWGRGVPQLMKGAQDRANAAVRALIVNVAVSSGPQILVDTSRLAKGEVINGLVPRKIWQTVNEFNLNAKPVDFIDIQSHAAELQSVYDRAVQDADVESGVPAYSYGSDQMGGPARTVGGLSILMNAAARGIKEAFNEIDSRAIQPLITRFYVWNMLYTDDPSIKGDIAVVARGASGTLLRELQLQKITEFMDRTNNPTDQEIIGIEGRAELLRQSAKLLNIDTTDVIPDAEELRKRVQQAQAEMAQQQQMQAMAQQMPQGMEGGENLMGTPPRATGEPMTGSPA